MKFLLIPLSFLIPLILLIPPVLLAPGDQERSEAKDLVLLFTGDIMLDRGVEYYVKENGGDWKFPFLKITEFLKKADLAFGNLESVISSKGTKLGSIYSFRADPESIEGLSFAGFDAVSVANNHSLDYGAEALLDSIARLEETGIAAVGAGVNKESATRVFVKEINGAKIGILAYTNSGAPAFGAGTNSPGVAWVDEKNLMQFKQDIENARKQADVLVVSIHFGEEYQTKPNATQELLAKTAIGAGANLVIGHHPHVVQPIAKYQQGWIAYSLGNFIFDQGFSKETMEGLILEVRINEKQISEVFPRPIVLNYLFQPSLAE